jgi:hypothetical protein
MCDDELVIEHMVDNRPKSGDIDFKKLAKMLTIEQRNHIISLYNCIKFTTQMMDAFIDNHEAMISDEDYEAIIANYVKCIEEMEFALQFWWDIPRNANYHTHWLKSKHCACPQMDNTDPVYFGGGKIINCDCPVHKHLIPEIG